MPLSRTSLLGLLIFAAAALAACGARETAPVEPAPREDEPEDHSAPTPEAGQEHAGHSDASAAEAGHDHDHSDEASGAGHAHVHGVADLALTWEGNRLTAELVSPLANFGLPEADGVLTEAVLAELPGLVMITGGDCAAQPPAAKVDTSSGHTDAHVNLAWTCTNPSGVSSVTFSGFTAFPSFERVNAVYLTDTRQKAGELSPSAPALSLK